MLSSLPAGLELGLIAYGHRKKASCQDIELVVPPAPGSAGAVLSAVERLKFLGSTPLSAAVQEAARSLNYTRDRATVILITDGLPTAHFEGHMLYLLYPPDPKTEAATMREGQLCQREGITINIFLLPNWSQSREDIQFAYRLAQSTKGRVFFTAGRDLDRYVVWDYVSRRREIIG